MKQNLAFEYIFTSATEEKTPICYEKGNSGDQRAPELAMEAGGFACGP
ncbi:hypothetical protein [Lactococcus termiticola]|nr:hypothetical protein [Lactococcus termiticola]